MSSVTARGLARNLSRQREELADRINTVNVIREQGALAVAGLTSYRPGRWFSATEPAFTSLARVVLTTRVDVREERTTVLTLLDPGTSLHRALRAREIREEFMELERRQRELARELVELDGAV